MAHDTTGPHMLGPDDGDRSTDGKVIDRFMIDGHQTGGRFALVEHIFEPHALAAPMHRHHLEDEFTYVLAGQIGAVIDGVEVLADPGHLVFKPRNQWHTFWNAGDEPCRILEIISPAGFERFFQELVDMGGVAQADAEAFAQLRQRYGLEMQPETVPELLERFGLRMGEPSRLTSR